MAYYLQKIFQIGWFLKQNQSDTKDRRKSVSSNSLPNIYTAV